MTVVATEQEAAPAAAKKKNAAAAAAGADDAPRRAAAGSTARAGHRRTGSIADADADASLTGGGGGGGGKRRKGRRRALGAALAVGALALAWGVGWGVDRASQDERVRAAVSDSVSRLNATLSEQFDVSLDGLLERLANLSASVGQILGDADDARPGQAAAAAGLRARHPVVIIPGFVTSGLELWQGEPCAQAYFRQRLWGALSMAQTLLADKACWLRHMRLDPRTGGDPPGVRLRAARALEAVDYFVPGYWVFSKMVQSLADLGYDNNDLVAVPYDWRLPLPVMERRDGFFTRVKREVELQRQLRAAAGLPDAKPVIVSHSFGGVVTLAFLRWVEQASPGWVDENLHAYINLAGPMLGLPKALSPLLSGETRETVDMMAGLSVLVENYLGRQSRAALFRTWGSVLAMLPVGGPRVWGNATHAPDDDPRILAAGRSYGGIVARLRSRDATLRDAVGANDAAALPADSLALLKATLTNWGQVIRGSLGGGAAGGAAGDDNDDDDSGSGSDGDEAADKEAAAGGNGGGKEKQQQQHNGDGDGSGSDSEQQQQQQQVAFLDVDAAITELAALAGEQLTLNLKRWAPAAQRLDLSAVLAHHRRVAEAGAAAAAAAAARQQREAGCCSVTPDAAGYQGACDSRGGAAAADAGKESCSAEGDGAAAGGDGSSCGSGSSSSSSRSSSSSAGAVPDGSKESARDVAAAVSGAGASGSGSGSEQPPPPPDAAAAADAAESEPLAPAPGEPCAVDPLRTPLPRAPRFRVYCMYGVGTDTERGYHYLKSTRGGAAEWAVNSLASDAASGLEGGVQLSPDGDGTVPLLSLGALCAGGWRTRRLNPAGLPVVVREYRNNFVASLKDARGGPGASTHVEILGNDAMLRDLLRVVAGAEGARLPGDGDDGDGDDDDKDGSQGEGGGGGGGGGGEGGGDGGEAAILPDRVHTAVREIAARIPWDEL